MRYRRRRNYRRRRARPYRRRLRRQILRSRFKGFRKRKYNRVNLNRSRKRLRLNEGFRNRDSGGHLYHGDFYNNSASEYHHVTNLSNPYSYNLAAKNTLPMGMTLKSRIFKQYRVNGGKIIMFIDNWNMQPLNCYAKFCVQSNVPGSTKDELTEFWGMDEKECKSSPGIKHFILPAVRTQNAIGEEEQKYPHTRKLVFKFSNSLLVSAVGGNKRYQWREMLYTNPNAGEEAVNDQALIQFNDQFVAVYLALRITGYDMPGGARTIPAIESILVNELTRYLVQWRDHALIKDKTKPATVTANDEISDNETEIGLRVPVDLL